MAADHQANNFDLLRVLAATSVVVSHSFPVVGAREPTSLLDPLDGSWGSLGVLVFFSISGYLVTLSWRSDPHAARFARRRALRIVPGLAVVAVFTALVLGPFVTSLPVGDYLATPSTWGYIPTTATGVLPSPDPPGLFAGQPAPEINASLWTIPFEILCYLGVAVLGLLGVLRHRAALTGLVLVGAVVANGRLVPMPSSIPEVATDAAPFLVAFFVSALLALERDRVKFVPWVAAVAFVGMLGIRGTAIGPSLAVLVAPYIVLTLALGVRVLPAGPLRRWDPSYGMYLFAFPVQQTVRIATGTDSAALVTVMTLVVIVPLSVASWQFVERRALALKPSRPTRAEASAQPV